MSLGIKNYRGLIRIVDLLHFKLIFFEDTDINMSKPKYISSRIRFDGYYSKIPIPDQYFSLISFMFFGIFVHVDIW